MRDDGSDAERRQVVVYVVGRAVLVAERFIGTRTWTPRLRIDLPRATEIVAIDLGWHRGRSVRVARAGIAPTRASSR